MGVVCSAVPRLHHHRQRLCHFQRLPQVHKTQETITNTVHRQKRMQWALDNENQDWNRIIWTDEASIQSSAHIHPNTPSAVLVTKMISTLLPHPILVARPSWYGRQSRITSNHCCIKCPFSPRVHSIKSDSLALNGQVHILRLLRGPLDDQVYQLRA